MRSGPVTRSPYTSRGDREPTGEVVAKLESSWPDWQFWTVPRAIGGTLWCARRWDDPKRVLHARGPDELVERLKAGPAR